MHKEYINEYLDRVDNLDTSIIDVADDIDNKTYQIYKTHIVVTSNDDSNMVFSIVKLVSFLSIINQIILNNLQVW